MMLESNEKRVLLIGNENEFLVKSVMNMLKNQDYEVFVCEPKVNTVSEAGKGINVWILFVEIAEASRELLVYLKDTVSDKRVELGLVGEAMELKEAEKYVQRGNIGKTFARPVDSKQICEGINALYEASITKAKLKRILVVDDDPEYLRRTQSVLHNHYKVYIANSGASALMLLSKHKVDLILLDYVMPVLDGPKVLEALKAEPDTADIPVIFLSGKTDVRSITTAMTLGSETYLSKALAATELAANIADFFAKKDWERTANSNSI